MLTERYRGFPGVDYDNWLNHEADLPGPQFTPEDDPEFEHMCRICGQAWEQHDSEGYCDDRWKRS